MKVSWITNRRWWKRIMCAMGQHRYGPVNWNGDSFCASCVRRNKKMKMVLVAKLSTCGLSEHQIVEALAGGHVTAQFSMDGKLVSLNLHPFTEES